MSCKMYLCFRKGIYTNLQLKSYSQGHIFYDLPYLSLQYHLYSACNIRNNLLSEVSWFIHNRQESLFFYFYISTYDILFT